ncbi:unnamed protein product [Merluccius merluccius]
MVDAGPWVASGDVHLWKTAPKPTPRNRASSYIPPSAPPAEGGRGAAGGGSHTDEAHPTKSNVHMGELGPRTPVSPNSFSYAPGLTF